jgi:hypothetical protein
MIDHPASESLQPVAEEKDLVGVATHDLLALQRVADIAAMCCIDLGANLSSAHKEYMAGEISNGAFQHVLARHTRMHAALREAGYTAEHAIFGWPVKPGGLFSVANVKCAATGSERSAHE